MRKLTDFVGKKFAVRAFWNKTEIMADRRQIFSTREKGKSEPDPDLAQREFLLCQRSIRSLVPFSPQRGNWTKFGLCRSSDSSLCTFIIFYSTTTPSKHAFNHCRPGSFLLAGLLCPCAALHGNGINILLKCRDLRFFFLASFCCIFFTSPPFDFLLPRLRFFPLCVLSAHFWGYLLWLTPQTMLQGELQW